MSNKIEELVETLSQMSVLQMSELKKALEDKWGVKAQAQAVAFAAPSAGGAPAAAAQEATDYSIQLEAVPADKKIGVIKIVREVTGLGLKEAKDLVDAAPKPLKDTAPKAEAESIKKKIEEAGGKVTLKPL